MASSMKAYLAAKYMSGPKADAILAKTTTTKKKKRKAAGGTSAAASSSFIKDDDLSGWAEPQKEEEGEATEAVVAEDRGFKKRQRRDEGEAGWATVWEPTPPPDEQPQVVEEAEETPFTGGLLTSAQLKKKLPKKSVQKAELTREEVEAAQETIYRDATGKKIDTAAERAEAARRKREMEEKEAKKLEWGKGLVQKDEAERQRRELENMRNANFSRTVDDVAMNEEMRAQDRWNDPAAAFLTVRCHCFAIIASCRAHVSCRKRGRRVPNAQSTQVHHHRQIGLVSDLDIDGMVSVRTSIL